MTYDELAATMTELGRRTHGVVSAYELRQHGACAAAVTAAVKSKRVERLGKGVYLLAGRPRTECVIAHAAIAHAGQGAVLTGLMAARWLKLKWVPDSGAAHVLIPPERRRRGTDGILLVRRCSWVDELVCTTMYGVPVAPVPQIVVDAARELAGRKTVSDEEKLQDIRGLVLGAVADKRCTVAQIRAVLARSAPSGTALLRRACVDAERGCASPPEAEFADALIGRGVPFYINCEIWLDGELLGVADGWLVGLGTGGELDSVEWHGSSEGLDATLLRHGRFAAAGLSLEHATPARFRRDPAAFVDLLLATAARRKALGVAEPSALELRPRGPLLR